MADWVKKIGLATNKAVFVADYINSKGLWSKGIRCESGTVPAAVSPECFCIMPLQRRAVRRRGRFLDGYMNQNEDKGESEDLPRSSQTNEARGQVSVKAFN